MTNELEELLDHIEDRGLREEITATIEARQKRVEREAYERGLLDRRVQRAEQHLHECLMEVDDGGWGEDRADEAAADLIRARDEKMKALDPEGYAEMRYMYGTNY